VKEDHSSHQAIAHSSARLQQLIKHCLCTESWRRFSLLQSTQQSKYVVNSICSQTCNNERIWFCVIFNAIRDPMHERNSREKGTLYAQKPCYNWSYTSM